MTSNGVVIGKDQCIDVYNGLIGVTRNAVYSYFEEESKGTMKEEKRADFVMLDKNPLKVPKLEIKDIQVILTIKDGEVLNNIER